MFHNMLYNFSFKKKNEVMLLSSNLQSLVS